MERQRKYSGYLTAGATMKRFIEGSQISQAIGLRHTLELARTEWPECAGALYYKMNDNYPAASWSTADWYGAPKIGHYICQDAFAPLHACLRFTHLDNTGVDVSWPVFLLDDADALAQKNWQVSVRAFGGDLRLIKAQEYSGRGGIEQVKPMGNFELSAAETNTNPLLVVAEIIKDGEIADRTFYWLNYEPVQDCLFELPRTDLSFSIDGSELTVTNAGSLPAVGVHFTSPEHSESFAASDSYFWLDPAESKTVTATRSDDLIVSGWNADEVGPSAQ
jgi:beta-mannosidase